VETTTTPKKDALKKAIESNNHDSDEGEFKEEKEKKKKGLFSKKTK